MKVGVLGSGAVAETLASGFLKHGHAVKVGSRSPGKLQEWVAKNPGGTAGTFAEAAGFGELLVLAVKGSAAADALRLAGAENLKGKTVINTVQPDCRRAAGEWSLAVLHGPGSLANGGFAGGIAEAHFVKAFNSVGAAAMVNPAFAAGKPSMFICGNDPGAKAEVGGNLDQFGWETEDMGGVEAARAIEPLCMLWCIPGFQKNDWAHAFKMLR